MPKPYRRWPAARLRQGTGILAQLFGLDEAAGREALLRFHLAVARDRQVSPADLARDLPQDQAARLDAMLREVVPPASRPGDAGARFPAAGGLPARVVYAMHFREGVLFACQPAAAADEAAAAAGQLPQPAGVPVLTPVAVLVTSLQDAAGLWVRLPAPEYFELLNEVGAELDRIFRQHRGRPGKQAGEVLACYFLPEADGSYLWNALMAAQQTRDAIRQVSRRWRAQELGHRVC